MTIEETIYEGSGPGGNRIVIAEPRVNMLPARIVSFPYETSVELPAKRTA